MKKKKIETTGVEACVRSMLSKYTAVLNDDVELSSRFEDDLGMDSIDRIELEMDIEEAFGFTFRYGQTDGVDTVGELIELVTALTDGTL